MAKHGERDRKVRFFRSYLLIVLFNPCNGFFEVLDDREEVTFELVLKMSDSVIVHCFGDRRQF